MKGRRVISPLALGAFLLSVSSALAAEPLTLSDVAPKVSRQNFAVLENAQRVYQAKESIQVARTGVLPRLNLWRWFSVPFDPKSALTLVEDVAPFLVPGNWFKIKEKELLYRAQTLAYQALWANEVLTAKSLFLRAALDRSLLSVVVGHRELLEQIHAIVRIQELLGGAAAGSSREVEIRILSLREDERALGLLLGDELRELSLALGMPASEELLLVDPEAPNWQSAEELNFESEQAHALSASPEVAQFEFLLAVADQVKKEVWFSFLGASSLSRGVAGGVFDGLPVQAGLGFGAAPSIRIIKSEKEILKLRKQGVRETLQRQLQSIAQACVTDLESHASVVRRVELARASLDLLFQRIRLGDKVTPFELVEASRNRVQAESDLVSMNYRFLGTQERLQRILFQGDYSKRGSAP